MIERLRKMERDFSGRLVVVGDEEEEEEERNFEERSWDAR